MSEPSDEALMRNVRDGDVAALGILFERHQANVHALCYRLVRRADAADDLVQETFFRVLRYRASFREEAAFTTWLYRIAWNVCHEQWRQTRRDEAPSIALTRSQVVEAPTLSERHVLLDEALGKLEPEQRAVLILTRYHDLTYDDVARVLSRASGRGAEVDSSPLDCGGICRRDGGRVWNRVVARARSVGRLAAVLAAALRH